MLVDDFMIFHVTINQSGNKHLLSTDYVPRIMLNIRGTKKGKNTVQILQELIF